MVSVASYARIHQLHGKITVQINGFAPETCLSSPVHYICQVLAEFSSCKEKLLSVTAGSGSLPVRVCRDISIQISRLGLVSVLRLSRAALGVSYKPPY